MKKSTLAMNPLDFTRRRFLGQMTTGLTGVALSRLLMGASATAAIRQPFIESKAKQVLQIFCCLTIN